MQSVDSVREVSSQSGQHARWCCRRWPEHAIQRRWCRSKSPRVATTFRLRCESALRSRSRFSGGRRESTRDGIVARRHSLRGRCGAHRGGSHRGDFAIVGRFDGLDREARGRLLALKAAELIHLIGERLAEDSGHQGRCRSRSNGSSRRCRQLAARRSSIVAFAARRSRVASRLDRIIGDRGSTAQRTARPIGHDSISAGTFALFAGRPFA